MQKYLEEALAWVNTKEVKGEPSNDDIIRFNTYTSLKATTDSTPWCSSFINFIVAQCGDKGTNSAAARSWLTWGKQLSSPTPGCIVVIDRKDANNPNAAHVGFYVCDGLDPKNILILGGNQSDSVKPAEFPRSKVIGYRDAL